MTDKSIVFYCKNCKGMIFASKNKPERLVDCADEIHQFILEGQRLDLINSEDIDEHTKWCKCDENPYLEDCHD